jgi:hypothetical protein
MHRLIEIPDLLQVEPDLRLHPEELLEAKRGVRCHPPLSIDDLVDADEGHADASGKILLGDVIRDKKLLAEHLARVRWWAIRWNTNHRGLFLGRRWRRRWMIKGCGDSSGSLLSPLASALVYITDYVIRSKSMGAAQIEERGVEAVAELRGLPPAVVSAEADEARMWRTSLLRRHLILLLMIS